MKKKHTGLESWRTLWALSTIDGENNNSNNNKKGFPSSKLAGQHKQQSVQCQASPREQGVCVKMCATPTRHSHPNHAAI